MFHPVLNENVASLLNSKPTVFHSFHQRNRNKAWQKLKLFFYSPHIFLSVTAQPTFSGDPSKSYIYLFIADKLIQCLQLLQMHPSVNHLQNVLTFVKSISGPRNECLALVLEWLSLGSVPSDLHTQRNCSGVGSPSTCTSRESSNSKTELDCTDWEIFWETYMGKRKVCDLVSPTAKGCLLKNKGEAGRELCIQKDCMQAPEAWHCWVNSWIQA